MESVKKTFFLIIGMVIIVWSFIVVLERPAPERFQGSPVVKVGHTSIPVEVADTDEERVLGLSYRKTLPEGTGLLFAFDTPAKYEFWMKDMNFPIDIVWIDEQWQVIGVDREVRPENYPEKYAPTSPAKYVLELNSGSALNLGIDTGVLLVFER